MHETKFDVGVAGRYRADLDEWEIRRAKALGIEDKNDDHFIDGMEVEEGSNSVRVSGGARTVADVSGSDGRLDYDRILALPKNQSTAQRRPISLAQQLANSLSKTFGFQDEIRPEFAWLKNAVLKKVRVAEIRAFRIESLARTEAFVDKLKPDGVPLGNDRTLEKPDDDESLEYYQRLMSARQSDYYPGRVFDVEIIAEDPSGHDCRFKGVVHGIFDPHQSEHPLQLWPDSIARGLVEIDPSAKDEIMLPEWSDGALNYKILSLLKDQMDARGFRISEDQIHFDPLSLRDVRPVKFEVIAPDDLMKVLASGELTFRATPKDGALAIAIEGIRFDAGQLARGEPSVPPGKVLEMKTAEQLRKALRDLVAEHVADRPGLPAIDEKGIVFERKLEGSRLNTLLSEIAYSPRDGRKAVLLANEERGPRFDVHFMYDGWTKQGFVTCSVVELESGFGLKVHKISI